MFSKFSAINVGVIGPLKKSTMVQLQCVCRRIVSSVIQQDTHDMKLDTLFRDLYIFVSRDRTVDTFEHIKPVCL
jgi:hypothetical protein